MDTWAESKTSERYQYHFISGLSLSLLVPGVLRHMQRYFSHICDGTDVQVNWRKCCTYMYGRAPNAIDISQGSLTCPSYTDTPPHLVAFYDTLGIRRTYSRLKPPASSLGHTTVILIC